MMNTSKPTGYTDNQIEAALGDALRSYAAPITDAGFSAALMERITVEAEHSARVGTIDLSSFTAVQKRDPKRTGLLFLAGFVGASIAASQLSALGRLLHKATTPGTAQTPSLIDTMTALPQSGLSAVKNILGQAPSLSSSLPASLGGPFNGSPLNIVATGPSGLILPVMVGFIVVICLWAVQSNLSNS